MKPPEISDKIYFKIGEVARIASVPPYVLRYWETEFKEIGPVKSRSGQRLYRKKDVETILAIKGLLYDQGFTLEGARKKIREAPQLSLSLGDGKREKALKKLRSRLEELLKVLEDGP